MQELVHYPRLVISVRGALSGPLTIHLAKINRHG